jgi:hypothetical protein
MDDRIASFFATNGRPFAAKLWLRLFAHAIESQVSPILIFRNDPKRSCEFEMGSWLVAFSPHRLPHGFMRNTGGAFSQTTEKPTDCR